MPAKKYKTVDEYHSDFSGITLERMNEIRAIIRSAAPKAEEVISYNMPGYRLNGMVVWYAGYNNHIGFYPSGSPIKIFKDDLKKYKTSKGAIQFPLDQKIPSALVKKITKFRIKENEEKQKKR